MEKGFKVIELSNRREWYKVVWNSGSNEIYHFPEFLNLLHEFFDCGCRLAYYTCENGSIYCPFILRKVDHIPHISDMLGGNYWEMISPWYYGGPVYNGNITSEDIRNLCSEIEKYCINNRIMTLNYRTNPNIKMDEDLVDFLGLQTHSRILDLKGIGSIDTSVMKGGPIEDTCSSTGDNQEVEFEASEDFCHLRHFFELYEKGAINEDEFHIQHLTLGFIARLMASFKEYIHLFSIRLGSSIKGGTVFLRNENKLFYLLSNWSDELKNESINRQFLAWMIRWAVPKGIEEVVICGPEDENGMMVSDHLLPGAKIDLLSMKKVLIPDIYNKVCGLTFEGKPSFQSSPYFPEYRDPRYDLNGGLGPHNVEGDEENDFT